MGPLWKVRALFAALFCAMLLCGCSAQPQKMTGFAFDTVISVTVYGAGGDAAIGACFDLFDDLDQKWNRFLADSEISRLNGGEDVELSAETAGVIERSMAYHKQTNGLFDIALGRLSDVWGFGGDSPSVPGDAELRAALEAGGTDKLTIGGGRIALNGAKVDIGAVAKGAAADMAAAVLRDMGVKSAVLDLGGDILCVGDREGRPFLIGVRRPFGEAGDLCAIVAVSDACVVTSGVYQRCFIEDGVLYPHVLDPRTGYPCDTDLLSATVIAESAERADAISTALLLMGSEDAMAYMQTITDCEAVLVTDTYRVIYTTGLEGKITLN